MGATHPQMRRKLMLTRMNQSAILLHRMKFQGDPLKIVAFNGSPRGRKSNTDAIASAFLEGAQEAGAQTQSFFLAEHKIKHCLGCLHCWLKTPGKCVQKDGMEPLLDAFIHADIAIMASPLYVDNVSGLMKNFIDRLIPYMNPHFVMTESGETGHEKSATPHPDFIVISNCGYPEQSQFQVLRLLFRRIARNMNARLVAEIYRGSGGIFGAREHPMIKPIVEEYLALVKQAGGQVVREGKILDATNQALEQQLIPTEIYIQQVNMMWDKLMDRGRQAKAEKQQTTE